MRSSRKQDSIDLFLFPRSGVGSNDTDHVVVAIEEGCPRISGTMLLAITSDSQLEQTKPRPSSLRPAASSEDS